MITRMVLIVGVAWVSSATAAWSGDAADVALAEAWHNASIGRGGEAREVFERYEGRAAQLGQALSLLGAQTRSVKSLTRAVELLSGIMEDDAGDELGLAACYYLGRIEQVHRRTPDLPAAMAHYRRLRATNPIHPLAEQALVKMGIIEIYAPDLSIDERRKVWTGYTNEVGSLVTSEARRDLNLLLAQAGQRYRFDPELILGFYLAVEQAGVARSALKADVYVNILNLARSLGRADLCREYCGKFMSGYRRDNRYHMVSEIRRELGGANDAGAPPATATIAPTKTAEEGG